MLLKKFQSRKFILAVVAQVVALIVLFLPEYENEIAQVGSSASALLLMALTAAGYIKAEASIDAAAVSTPTPQPEPARERSAGAFTPRLVGATVLLLMLSLPACAANTARIDGRSVSTTAQPASLATMDIDGNQRASFLGVPPTQLKQDTEGNWLTTPGQGGIITFPTAAGPVYLWSPKDGRIENLAFTPNPNPGEPAVSATLIELNLSTVASVYAGQFEFAMDAIKDMTRAEAEARIKQMEQARLITADVAQVLIAAVLPLLP